MFYLCAKVSGYMDFQNFIRSIEFQLQQPLPGQMAQLKMSSQARLRELMTFSHRDDARQSSVLLLLYPCDEKVKLVLMLRPDYNGVHSGQISFPGGKYEDGDDDLIFTALREAREEIGIDVARVQILGQLTEMYIPPSNYIVSPVVAYLLKPPQFSADPLEVAKIIEVTTEELLDESNDVQAEVKVYNGKNLTVPAFCIRDNIIWGATAMILSEFREILKKAIL